MDTQRNWRDNLLTPLISSSAFTMDRTPPRVVDACDLLSTGRDNGATTRATQAECAAARLAQCPDESPQGYRVVVWLLPGIWGTASGASCGAQTRQLKPAHAPVGVA